MPLICCDTCSELDFKLLGFGAVYVGMCAFCKKLSSHSAVEQYNHFNPKQAKSDKAIDDPYTMIHASGATKKENLDLSFQVTSSRRSG
jgi:hypothetical protein